MMLGKVRRSQAKLGDAGDMPTSNQIEVKTKLVSPGDETIRIESGQSVSQAARARPVPFNGVLDGLVIRDVI